MATNNLAKQMPEKLRELQRLWMIEATKYNVLPLDDRFAERANPDLAGRPQLIRGDRQLLFGGMGRLTESSIINIKNKSHEVTAEVEITDSVAEGVITPTFAGRAAKPIALAATALLGAKVKWVLL